MSRAFIKRFSFVTLLLIMVFTVIACDDTEDPVDPIDPVTYTVTFNTNGGSTISAITIEENETVTQPTNPAKEGYTFVYWYLNDTSTAFDFTTTIDSDLTLYALWDQNTVTVTFDTDGGTNIDPVEVIPGDTLTLPENPAKKDFIFDGWYMDENHTQRFDSETSIDENLELYAKYKDYIYTLTFDTNGGSNVVSYKYKTQTPINAPSNATKVGHSLEGWYTDEALTTPFVFDAMPDEDMTIYAKWEVNQYTISFESGGGTVIENMVEAYGETIAKPEDPTFEAYGFLGWFTDRSYKNVFDFDTMPARDIVLYAKWDMTDEQRVTTDVSSIDIPAEIDSDINLPSYGSNGTQFEWVIDQPHLISKDGQVNLAGYGSGGQLTNIELIASYNNLTESFFFETVVAESGAPQITSSDTYQFYNLAEEYTVEDGQIDLYFVNNQDIPFVDVESFIKLLDGAIESVAGEPVEITGDDDELYMAIYYMEVIEDSAGVITVRYTQEFSQEGVIQETYVYEATLDFNENTYYSVNFDFHESLGAATSTDFGEGLTFGDSIITEGTGLEISFNDYRIDLIEHVDGEDQEYLMPLYLANLLFVGGVYYDVYYNGDALYGVDSYQLLDGDPAVDIISESSFNDKDISLAMKAATYDYLALVFDYFYGLKNVNGIDTYYNVFDELADDIIFGRDYKHYKTIFDLTYDLDDLHTYHILSGFYSEPDFGFQYTSLGDFGTRTAGYYQAGWAIDDAIAANFPNGVPQFRETPDGKTAIIPINSFTVDTPTEFNKAIELALLEYPNIENVVVDITNNGGGNVGAVWRTLGYMTDDVIYYHSQNPTDGAKVTYQIYDDYVAYEFNWFILTSKVTFSAANLMAATAKEQGIATVIGLKSSGGASSISGTVLPTGDVIFLSSTNVISTKDSEGNYISVEYGVDPDILFSGVSALYNDEYIEDVVNQATGLE